MRREPVARSPSPLGDGLGKVDAAARHLLGVINHVLDLSKIEAGKQPLELADFELDEVLAAALAMVDRAAFDKGLSLVLDAPGLPTRLRGDAQCLTQALVNLLANAVKFTDRGSVCLRGLRLDDLDGRIRLRFEVQDTGIGIPAAQQPALFQPFEQGDASTTRRHGGTGLGLALTRHLVALMGGRRHRRPGCPAWGCGWTRKR
jgi:two-component system, sensor histidine kinase and response regulator